MEDEIYTIRLKHDVSPTLKVTQIIKLTFLKRSIIETDLSRESQCAFCTNRYSRGDGA